MPKYTLGNRQCSKLLSATSIEQLCMMARGRGGGIIINLALAILIEVLEWFNDLEEEIGHLTL